MKRSNNHDVLLSDGFKGKKKDPVERHGIAAEMRRTSGSGEVRIGGAPFLLVDQPRICQRANGDRPPPRMRRVDLEGRGGKCGLNIREGVIQNASGIWSLNLCLF